MDCVGYDGSWIWNGTSRAEGLRKVAGRWSACQASVERWISLAFMVVRRLGSEWTEMLSWWSKSMERAST